MEWQTRWSKKPVPQGVRVQVPPLTPELMEEKVCKICTISQSINCFEKQLGKNGKAYYRSTCNSCKNKNDYTRDKNSGRYNRRLKKRKIDRQDPKNRPSIILKDSKNYDKIAGLENDLDKEFIADLIKNGCFYCKINYIKIGLDRIDHRKGHLKNNVVPACSRCNFIRKDMPYEAWIELTPKIQEITEKGLFGDWFGNIPHHFKRSIKNETINSNRD